MLLMPFLAMSWAEGLNISTTGQFTTSILEPTTTMRNNTLVCGSVVSGSTVGMPDTIGNPAGDVKFWFCPGIGGTVTISTCESGFDTFLHVKGPGVDISCDDCGPCGTRAVVEVDVVDGVCYEIYVDGYGIEEGDYMLSFTCPKSQNTSTNATAVECGSAVSGSNVGLPDAIGFSAGDVKFLFCPNITGRVTISSCGSSFNTFLHAQGPNVDVVSRRFGPCDPQDVLSFHVLDGLCYEVYLDGLNASAEGNYAYSYGYAAAEGDYMLSFTCFETVTVGCGSEVAGSTVGMPDTSGVPSGDAEFLFCPNITSRVTISSCGSDFNTYLHARGPHVDAVCNDCGPCGAQDVLSFHVVGGLCYEIHVGGWFFEEGNYTVSFACPIPVSSPNATAVECGRVVSGSTVGMPDTIGNPAGDVKFLFCPDIGGTVTISTCESGFDTFLHVKGPGVDISCDDCGPCGTRAVVEVDVVDGVCYEIHVDGYDIEEGDYVLALTCPSAVGASATAVECGSVVSGSTVGLPNTIGYTAGDANFSFCPNTTGRVTVSTCQSSFFTWLHVQGPRMTYSCGDCGFCDRARAGVSFDFSAGDCFSIAIEGPDGQPDFNEGEYIMSLSCTEATPTVAAPALTCPVYIDADAQLQSQAAILPL